MRRGKSFTLLFLIKSLTFPTLGPGRRDRFLRSFVSLFGRDTLLPVVVREQNRKLRVPCVSFKIYLKLFWVAPEEMQGNWNG